MSWRLQYERRDSIWSKQVNIKKRAGEGKVVQGPLPPTIFFEMLNKMLALLNPKNFFFRFSFAQVISYNVWISSISLEIKQGQRTKY